MLNYLLGTKQLSIYLIFVSLIVTSAMMHPRFTTLVIAIPVNALTLFILRWVAHKEGRMMF